MAIGIEVVGKLGCCCQLDLENDLVTDKPEWGVLEVCRMRELELLELDDRGGIFDDETKAWLGSRDWVF